MKRTAWLWVLAIAAGCTSSAEKASVNDLAKNCGNYNPPPPTQTWKPKVGIPKFTVEKTSVAKKDELALDAGDQLTTLTVLTERFQVIERAQLQQLLKEQGLEGIVDPEEMAQPGRVKGVHYLLIGKVTNFRTKKEQSSSGFDLGMVPVVGRSGVFDINDKSSKITVECGVDIRLVDPTTGVVASAAFGEYKRTDSIGATGVHVLGVGGDADADLQIDEDSAGLILRLALDDAMKKMLPKADVHIQRKQAELPPPKRCECGKELPTDAKECPGCGKKFE